MCGRAYTGRVRVHGKAVDFGGRGLRDTAVCVAGGP